MEQPKKNILFIMNNMNCGGAEKALVSLLQVFDYSKYNVSLLLFKKEGIFLDKLPKQVVLLDEPNGYSYFDMSLKKALFQCLKKGRFDIIINRILALFVLKSEKNPAVKEQKLWKYLAPGLKKIDNKYDVAIGFLEKNPNYFCVDKVQATTKIAWIHTNYSNMGMQPKYDRKYFDKTNFIATISTECAQNLKDVFPESSTKIKVIQNIISPSIIKAMANETEIETLNFSNAIVSVGRLSHEKGFDLAVEASKILKDKNINFRWYFIGDGNQREILEQKIESYQLQNNVLLLGLKDNPYPYVKKAKIYAQTSRFEGKSIAIDEAKILQKPLLVTNFTTAVDQITHLQNGYIANMNPEAIANGIIEVLTNKELQEHFITNLAKENLSTEAEVEKLYELINN